MREAIVFLLKISVKHGIWIFGVAWLVAIGSQWIYVKGNQSTNMKKRVYFGIIFSITGTILAIIPIF